MIKGEEVVPLFLGKVGVGEAKAGERVVLRRESSQKERERMFTGRGVVARPLKAKNGRRARL